MGGFRFDDAAPAWLALREFYDRARPELARAGLALGFTLAAVLALRVVRGLGRRARARVAERPGRELSFRVRGVELLPPGSVARLLGAATRGLESVLLVLVVSIYLSAMLGLFPGTRTWEGALLGRLAEVLGRAAMGIAEAVPGLLAVAFIAWVTTWVNRLLARVFDRIEAGGLALAGLPPELVRPTRLLVRVLSWAVAISMAYPYLPGSSTQAFQGVALLFGAVASFGSGSAVSNTIAGLVLTYSRALSVGDWVKAGGEEGQVEGQGLFALRLRTRFNEVISLPYSTVLGGAVVNYSQPTAAPGPGLRLHTAVTISYDVPWRTVHRLLIEAALETPGVLSDPAPFVLQTALDDFYVRYEVNAATRLERPMYLLYGELHQRIQDHFNAAGVEILSPHYTSLRDGTPSTAHSRQGTEPNVVRAENGAPTSTGKVDG